MNFVSIAKKLIGLQTNKIPKLRNKKDSYEKTNESPIQGIPLF